MISIPSQVTQLVADLLLKRVMPHLDDRGKTSAGDDLSIDDLPLSPRQVADLAVLIEDGKVSPAAAASIIAELIDGQKSVEEAIVKDVVSAMDMWMTDDRDWILSLMQDRLKGETKQLLKDNPKKNARAKMTIIGVTLKASGLKANPLLVKSMVEDEVQKLKAGSGSA